MSGLMSRQNGERRGVNETTISRRMEYKMPRRHPSYPRNSQPSPSTPCWAQDRESPTTTDALLSSTSFYLTFRSPEDHI